MKKFSDMYINEGFFNSTGTGFFATIGCFFGLTKLTDDKNKSETEKTLEKIYAERKENAKKRLEELMKSKDGARAAKLMAKHNLRERQLSLANSRKVSAFNAAKAKLTSEGNFFKSTNFTYSDDEMAAYNKTIDKELKDLEGTSEYDKAEKLADMTRMVCLNEDGTVRTKDEINQFLENNADIKTEFDNAAKACDKNIADAMQSPDVTKYLKEVSDSNTNLSTAQSRKNDADGLIAQYNERADKVKEYKDAQKNYNALKQSQTEIDGKIADAENERIDKCSLFYPKENKDIKTTEILKPSQVIENISKKLSAANTEEERNAVLDELKNSGLPDAFTNKLTDEINGSAIEKPESGNISEDTYKTLINNMNIELSTEDIKSAADKTLKDTNDKISTTKAEKDRINAQMEQITDPTKDDKFESLRNLEKEESLDIYDKDTELGKKALDDLKKMQKEADDSIKERQSIIDSMKKKRKEAEDRYNTHKENDAYPELVALAGKKERDFNDGEVVNSGKIGFYEKNEQGNSKFIERPKMDATKEEREAYEEKRKKMLLITPANELAENAKKTTIEKIEKTSTGKYKLTINGKEQEYDEADAAALMAARNVAVQTKHNAYVQKQTFLNSLKGCFDEDGKLIKDKYDKLSDTEKGLIDDIEKMDTSTDEGKSKLAELKKSFDGLSIGGEKIDKYISDKFDDEGEEDLDDTDYGDDKDSDKEEGDETDNAEEGHMKKPKRYIKAIKGKRKGTHRYVVCDVRGDGPGAPRKGEDGKKVYVSKEEWQKNKRYWIKYKKSKTPQQEPAGEPVTNDLASKQNLNINILFEDFLKMSFNRDNKKNYSEFYKYLKNIN